MSVDKDPLVELLTENLKYCPVCAKELEPHPNADNKRSCFAHGDFVVVRGKNSLTIAWEFLGGPF